MADKNKETVKKLVAKVSSEGSPTTVDGEQVKTLERIDSSEEVVDTTKPKKKKKAPVKTKESSLPVKTTVKRGRKSVVVDPNVRLIDGKKKKVSGRPRVIIDLVEARKLGELQCTLEEASAFLEIPVGTLSARPDFTDAFNRGKELGKRTLRRHMWKHAETNTSMCIFMSKNLLGYRDSPPEEEQRPANVTITMIPKKLADDIEPEGVDE